MAEQLISCGPLLTSPDTGKITVLFTTRVPGAGTLFLRRKGTEQWKVLQNVSGGQTRLCDTRHIFHLKKLVPGSVYEYRITALDQAGNFEEKTAEFTAFDPAKKDCSFLVLADLQFAREKRRELIRSYHSSCDADKCDFVVMLGDMCSRIDSFEEDILEDHVRLLCELGADRRPVVFLRGNHELRGTESCRWEEFFDLPYFSFRLGPAAFLALDSWSDQPACNGKNFEHNHDREFLAAEKRFLNRAVKKEDFLQAPFKMVLSHGASHTHIDQFDFLGRNLRNMTDGLFRGSDPAVRIHLWICGHIHHYIRSVPGKAECVSINQPPQPVVTPEDYLYPVITTDGPDVKKEIVPPSGIQSSAFKVNVTEKEITVTSIAAERGIIDKFRISADGNVSDLADAVHYFWNKN